MMRIVGKVVTAVAYLGGLCLIGLVVLIVVSVAMRQLFGAPIIGALDISQVGLAVVVFSSLALSAHTRSHISIDFLGSLLPARLALVLDLFVKLLCAGLLLFIAYHSIGRVGGALKYNDSTMLVHIPNAPFIAYAVFGFALYALVLIVQLAEELPKIAGEEGHIDG